MVTSIEFEVEVGAYTYGELWFKEGRLTKISIPLSVYYELQKAYIFGATRVQSEKDFFFWIYEHASQVASFQHFIEAVVSGAYHWKW